MRAERPDPPSHVHIVHVSSRYISLAWAPPFDGNSPLSHYVLQHWPLAPVPHLASSLMASSQGHQVTSSEQHRHRTPSETLLTPSGRAYLPSELESFYKSSGDPDVPGHPGERLDSHPVPLNTTVRADVTEAKIELLTPGVTYLLQLLAVNSLGASEPSPPLSVTTHQEPPAQPPDSLHAARGGLGQITVTWKVGYQTVSPKTLALHRDHAFTKTQSSDTRVSAFVPPGQAEMLSGDDNSRQSDSNEFSWRSFRPRDSEPDLQEPSLTLTLRGLKHYTKYALTVRAVNEVGPGPMARPVTVTTSEAPPVGTPGSVECSALSPRSVRVRWTPLPDNATNGVILGYKLTYYKLGHLTKGPPNYEMKRTTNLETNLQGLERYSNYSVTVRAYNGAGDGQPSNFINCRTLEDVPSTPSPMKAVAGGPDSVVLGWHAPLHPNGALTHYTLYYRPLNAHHAKHSVTVDISRHLLSPPTAVRNVNHSYQQRRRRDTYSSPAVRRPMSGVFGPHLSNVPADVDVSELVDLNAKSAFWIQEIDNLDGHASFEFWMTASTGVGESPPSRVVVQSPTSRVDAEILTKGGQVVGVMGSTLTLPCPTIGSPAPVVTWSAPGKVLAPHNALVLPSLGPQHSLNYTCTARNTHNSDTIVWALRVVSTPVAPTPFVEHSTESAIHITWSPPAENGGLPIVGYIIRYKLMHPDTEDGSADKMAAPWQELVVDAGHKNYAVPDLLCGSTYRLLLLSSNALGRSVPSVHVTTRTKGAVPRMPRWQDLLSINSTAINVHLYAWLSGGCDIVAYAVVIRPLKQGASPQDTVVLGDLEPSTWYHVTISATNSAGTTTRLYNVATADITGGEKGPLLLWVGMGIM
ncbi:Fibronectin type III [Trinorchestia longiramus]|nr:Fibronectin type III [Trinorchestia longiramus]